jgi:hypothetical protein
VRRNEGSQRQWEEQRQREEQRERKKSPVLLPKASHLPADELDLELFQLLVCDSVFGERERERERERVRAGGGGGGGGGRRG